jgi:hypothetical protein
MCYPCAQQNENEIEGSCLIFPPHLSVLPALNKLYIFNTNTNHQQMHKESFIINRNTLLHVSTLLGHLQGETFCCRYTKVALYS